MSERFIAFRGGADGPAGLMLAINPRNVDLITSVYDKNHQQDVLRLHLSNGRIVKVFASDVKDVLEALELGEYVGDWILNLEKDIA
jgi:hypothetical protein